MTPSATTTTSIATKSVTNGITSAQATTTATSPATSTRSPSTSPTSTTSSSGVCLLEAEELAEGARVLVLMDGLLYAGYVRAITPPEIYGEKGAAKGKGT